MKRRLAIFFMAVWLTGIVFMALVAAENFWTLDRLFAAKANPAFAGALEKFGTDTAHNLVHYYSSELNRLYFQVWGLAEIGVGIFVFWCIVALPKAAKAKWMVLSMLAITLLFAVLITPQIVSVGRALDFVPRDPPPPELRTFGLLHAAYTVLDGIKFILGILVSLALIRVREVRFDADNFSG
jgi:hypothetical protein